MYYRLAGIGRLIGGLGEMMGCGECRWSELVRGHLWRLGLA